MHFNIYGPNWPEFSRLLDQALDLPPEQRTQWLDALDCVEPMRSSLRSVLANAAEVEARDFLSRLPKLHLIASELAQGEGHDGTVWLAERVEGLVILELKALQQRPEAPCAIVDALVEDHGCAGFVRGNRGAVASGAAILAAILVAVALML